MAKKEIDTTVYVDKYSDEGLMSKIKRVGKKMGGKLLYNVYVLYYVLKLEKTEHAVTGARMNQ